MQVQIQPNKSGQLYQTDFGDNTGGINLADSVFKITENQAAGGTNFDYILTGGIRKRLAPSLINAVADAQLKSLGFGLYYTAGGVKSVIRAAGTKIQLFDVSAPSFTNLTTDTTSPTSDVLTSGTTQSITFTQFNNGSSNILWGTGGGMVLPYGVFSTTGITKNGINPPTGSIQVLTGHATGVIQDLTYTYVSGSTVTVKYIAGGVAGSEVVTVTGSNIVITIANGVSTATQVRTAFNLVAAATALASCAVTGTGSNSQNTTGAYVALSTAGAFASTGTVYYAVSYRKLSTQALGNVALDALATLAATTNTVFIDLTGLSNLDTTLYDDIYIYRSGLSGVSGFTTGDLIAQIPSTQTSFVDTGSFISTANNVARAGNVVLDNSVLPAGTYNSMCIFKRRLVVAQNSTLYFSDLNKSESWPLTNYLTVPSGGNITALASISFTSPQAQTLDEILVIFKEREVWVVTGSDYTTWALKFIDQVGCLDQNLVVIANGFLSWIDFRGVYLWDGASKPTYCSRLIQPLFGRDGDLDKTKFSIGTAEFFRKENQIVWYLSSKTYGEQKFAIKMDLRLTLPQIQQDLTGRNLDAIFTFDNYSMPIYGGLSYLPSNGGDEQLILGDASGFCYQASQAYADGGSAAYSMKYMTKPLAMGDPNTRKIFHKVIAWVQDIGTWNLTLDYWSDYKTGPNYQSTKALPISSENETSTALWDIAYWDVGYWDQYFANVVPIIFNLEPGIANSNIGSAIQLQFRNDAGNQPITIHGFSVIWSPESGVTA